MKEDLGADEAGERTPGIGVRTGGRRRAEEVESHRLR